MAQIQPPREINFDAAGQPVIVADLRFGDAQRFPNQRFRCLVFALVRQRKRVSTPIPRAEYCFADGCCRVIYRLLMIVELLFLIAFFLPHIAELPEILHHFFVIAIFRGKFAAIVPSAPAHCQIRQADNKV